MVLSGLLTFGSGRFFQFVIIDALTYFTLFRNGPRNGYPNAPVNQKAVERNAKDKAKGYNKPRNPNEPKQLHAGFKNTGTNPKYKSAKLYFEDTFWGNLGFDDEPLGVNTFKGHRWNVRVGDEVVIRWVIDDRDVQTFEI